MPIFCWQFEIFDFFWELCEAHEEMNLKCFSKICYEKDLN